MSTTAVDFARELAEAIETQAVEEFRAKHRGAALWVLEDLGQLATRRSGKLSAQEELIHTLDALLAAGRWAVVTCSALPAELPGILPALQSRLMGGLTVPMSPPGVEARLAIIDNWLPRASVPLAEPVAQILAEGLDGTARELAGAMLELMAMRSESRACKQPPYRRQMRRLDADSARRYVAERNHRRGPSLHEIALATAKAFFAAIGRLAESGPAPGPGDCPRRGRLPCPPPRRRDAGRNRPLFRQPAPYDDHSQLPKDGGIAQIGPDDPRGD